MRELDPKTKAPSDPQSVGCRAEPAAPGRRPADERPGPARQARLLSSLVHELGTPLGSVLMLSEMLSEAGGDADAGRLQARKIHQAASDMRNLLDQVALLARIETGRVSPVVGEVSLDALVEELERELAGSEPPVTLELAPDAPRAVATDTRYLIRAMRCLVSGGTAGEGIRVALGRDARPEGQGGLWIRVWRPSLELEGPHGELLFEPFHVSGRSVRRRHGGQSLDLPIARALLDQLGGSISVTGGADGIAVFSLYLG